MDKDKQNDLKDTAIKLESVYINSPLDYYYLKGYIHCLLQTNNLFEKQHKVESINNA